MADSTVPLTFAVHSNPGAYAVLLGSGVSTGAGIPTGRQIVADLTSKIALLEGAGAVDDPVAWYRDSHGHDPDYSQLLAELAPSPAERSQLFAPTSSRPTLTVRRACACPAPHIGRWLNSPRVATCASSSPRTSTVYSSRR